MGKRDHYQYYVEGECEQKLIDVLKKEQTLIKAGKVNVFNVIQEEITNARLRILEDDTIAILVFDTDTDYSEVLRKNISKLKASPRIKDIWLVIQVKNLEDELCRSTDIRRITDLLESKSTKDFKSDFLREKNLYRKLVENSFDIVKIWSTQPDAPFEDLRNMGYLIKLA